MKAIVTEIRTMNDKALDEWAEDVIERAKEHFKQCGHVSPVMLAIGKHLEDEKLSLLHVVPMGEFLRDERSKDLIADLMPKVLKSIGAYACVRVIESWLVDTRGSKDESLDDAEKNAERLKREYGGSLEHVPGRREAITVSFESQLKSWLHTIEIVRDENDKGSIGKEERLAEDGAMTAGRMVGWLDDRPDVSELN